VVIILWTPKQQQKLFMKKMDEDCAFSVNLENMEICESHVGDKNCALSIK
jgi:hypothetical protein